MTETSKQLICKECNKKSTVFFTESFTDFVRFYRERTPVGSILFLFAIFFILFVFPAWGQNNADEKIAAKRENRENRSQRSASVQNLEQEIQESSKAIPWNSFSPQVKAKVRSVVSDHPLFRRMPQQIIHADPEMFQFLSEHPDLVVGFWERMGVTQLSVKELKKDQFAVKETSGTTAVAEIVYRTKDTCIVYAKGQYKGPFLAKSYDGSVVLVLRSRFLRDADNEPVIVCDLDSFVRIDNLGVDFIAKLLSTSLGKIADSNFEQTISFVGYVSESAGIHADSLKRTGYQVKGVRDAVQEDFADVVDRVAMRFARRNNSDGVPHYVSALANSPELTEAPFAHKISSERSKQEFDNVFHSDPFFTAQGAPEKSRKKEEPQLTEVTEAEKPEELSEPAPISIGISMRNQTLNQENVSSETETISKSRAVFITPKIAR